MELKLNHCYIIASKLISENIDKIEVLEITEKSISFNMIDINISNRLFLKDFNEMYEVVEELGLSNNKIRGFEVVEKRKFPESNIIIPRRADAGSCGYDLYSPINYELKPGESKLIFTDLKAYMLKDEVLEMNVRSSMGKIRIRLANTIGWIDSTYYNNVDNEGNIGIYLENCGDKDFCIYKDVESGGTEFKAIAQVKFSKYLIVDNDSPVSHERVGGFGSTNINTK